MSLQLSVSPSRENMGRAAAQQAARHIRQAVVRHGLARVAFAAAPSQHEFLAVLRQDERVDWSKVIAFHLDEYVGLPAGASERFGSYLDVNLFRHVNPKAVYYVSPEGFAPEAACRRYEALLDDEPLHLMCIGVGENGHLAFNDPHVADFDDPAKVKVVALDLVCRQQQVNDGCFASLADVPKQAITLTMPTILAAEAIVCVVPGQSKHEAVKRALQGPISTDCPASALRTHPNAALFLDQASGQGLEPATVVLEGGVRG